MMEFMHSHSSVIFQPDFDDPRYSGVNPYALGFAMMQDIRRICSSPSEEDREWFPDIAGCGDWRGVLKDAWANYRDESFILQFLSPTVIRSMRMFALTDDSEDPHVEISAIHNEQGFRRVRERLAHMYDLGMHEPNIQVVAADLEGDRMLTLNHIVHAGRKLDPKTMQEVMLHVHNLWGHKVRLDEEPA
jgi:spore cortex formation protein SpoVR/YcgB (stage V sporulation)